MLERTSHNNLQLSAKPPQSYLQDMSGLKLMMLIESVSESQTYTHEHGDVITDILATLTLHIKWMLPMSATGLKFVNLMVTLQSPSKCNRWPVRTISTGRKASCAARHKSSCLSISIVTFSHVAGPRDLTGVWLLLIQANFASMWETPCIDALRSIAYLAPEVGVIVDNFEPTVPFVSYIISWNVPDLIRIPYP